MESVESLLRSVVRRWRPELADCKISLITPDASLRRYYRLGFSQPISNLSLANGVAPQSAVAMVFDSIAGAEVGTGVKINTDEACVKLTAFFIEHGVSVPSLYFDARDAGVLLIEDLGDKPLISVLLPGADAAKAENLAEKLYKQAIDQITCIQQIPIENSFFPFQRELSREVYLSEMQEFNEFFLSAYHLNSDQLQLVERTFQRIAQELTSLPRVLVHRDFHSWNLLVDEAEDVRVIDFQDALLGTRSYDLVALLNDRDTDAALGAELYAKLLRYFADRTARGGDFPWEYDRVLLQRDLKVVGRFSKLVNLRKLENYRRWIPGTLRRVFSSLERIVSAPITAAEYPEFYRLLTETVTERK